MRRYRGVAVDRFRLSGRVSAGISLKLNKCLSLSLEVGTREEGATRGRRVRFGRRNSDHHACMHHQSTNFTDINQKDLAMLMNNAALLNSRT